MDKLPRELWIEILEFLSVSDLLRLTECCKEFKSIICETKLMEKFTLHTRNDLEWDEAGRRKFSQMEIKGCNDIEKLVKMIAAVGKDLKRISVMKIDIKLSDLQRTLSLCPRLRQFHFSDVKIEEDVEVQAIEIYENIKITFEDSSPLIFKLFMKSSATAIFIDNKCSNEIVNFHPLRDFLKTQTSLRSLGLAYFSINTNLFADNELDLVPFRLEKFSMNNVYLGIESVARFHTFLMNHRETIKFLFLQSPFVDVSFFKQFPALKELQLCHTNAFFDPFDNIEKLTVENVSGNFMVKFPNVRELTMIYKYGVFIGMYADLVKLTCLETLSIIDSKIPELNVPTVKRLVLKNATICHKRPFRYEDNQIGELHLDACSNIEWIADYLAQENTRLRVLVIENMNINALIHKLIDSCVGRKIKLLKMINNNAGD